MLLLVALVLVVPVMDLPLVEVVVPVVLYQIYLD
jgi:hypothetical protein